MSTLVTQNSTWLVLRGLGPENTRMPEIGA